MNRIYIIVIRDRYIRDAQVFTNADLPENALGELEESDIYFSAELESCWKDREIQGYLCCIECSRNKLETKMKRIAKEHRIPEFCLQAIPFVRNKI